MEERHIPIPNGVPLPKQTGPTHSTRLQQGMHVQMMKLVAGGVDLAEIYSPPRVGNRAGQWALNGG